METRCLWQQADFELLLARGTYVPNIKLDQKSFRQQSIKCMPMLPWLQHFHTNKLHILLSLPESTCLPSMKSVGFNSSHSGKIAPLMPISSSNLFIP